MYYYKKKRIRKFIRKHYTVTLKLGEKLDQLVSLLLCRIRKVKVRV